MIKSRPQLNPCKILKIDMSNRIFFGRHQASPTGPILMNLALKSTGASVSEKRFASLCPENIC